MQQIASWNIVRFPAQEGDGGNARTDMPLHCEVRIAGPIFRIMQKPQLSADGKPLVCFKFSNVDDL